MRASVAFYRIGIRQGLKLWAEDFSERIAGDFSTETHGERAETHIRTGLLDYKQWVVDHEIGTPETRERFMAQLALRSPEI
jgi:hypothetical protein